MFPRNTISLALAGMIFLQSFSFSSAQSVNNSDKEYDAQVQEDMQGVSGNEGFSRIEKSVDKSLLDTSYAKLARKTAKDYIDSIKNSDTHWKGNNPKLIGKPVPYYTDDSSTPISYEWKVKCSNTNDCGSVMVAVADNIARVMEAGTYGTANYERLGTGKESRKNKLYYYSAFDQYIESSSGSDVTVDVIDPGIALKKSNSERKDELKSRKDSVKSMRKGGKLSFQEADTSLTTRAVMTGTPSSVTTSSLAVTAAAASTMADVQHMTPSSNCSSALPCYQQFDFQYNYYCKSGCSPTAMAIIFGYYDKMNLFPNLVPGVVASDYNQNDINIKTMINTIRGYMVTNCSGTGSNGSTFPSSVGKGMKYARDKGYTNSLDGKLTTSSIPATLMNVIKTEINAARPLIVNYSGSGGHSMPAYGYNSTGNSATDQVHVNFGFGNFWPDKYISISSTIVGGTNSNDGTRVIAGMHLTSVVTVPVKF